MAEEILCPHCQKSIDDFVNDAKTKRENMKELYQRYNQCRDYQLERFWKNSIFVWTFLAICFTSYGTLVIKYISKNSFFLDNYFAVLCTLICVVALVLSAYWLWLSKSSKAWVEVFETAIWNIESRDNYFAFEQNYLIHNFWMLKTEKDFLNKSFTERMFSTRNFSPSKIVIAIAWLVVFVWVFALIFELLVYYADSERYSLICCVIAILFFIAFFIISLKEVKSSTLRDYSDQKIFEDVRNKITENKLPSLYFEVKKGVIAFFFSNEDDKKINEQKIKKHFANYECKDAEDTNLVLRVYAT